MRKHRDLHAAIKAAAKDGRGLSLTPVEVARLARQQFVELPQELFDIQWRAIPGYERYEVSEKGHVRRGMSLLKQTASGKYGHYCVTVYDSDGKQWRVGVHHLVAFAFYGPAPDGKPMACHENGHAWDNRVENIYWGSRADNAADMVRHGRLAATRAASVRNNLPKRKIGLYDGIAKG